MKRTLTRAEMLELWRNYRTGEPLRLDCTVTRTDGTDFDAVLAAEMRSWYLALLDAGDESLLAPVDMAPTAIIATSPEGLTVIRAPQDVRRILRVRFAGWPAELAPDADEAEVRARAANPYSRRPAIARTSAGELIVSGAVGMLTNLICTVDHGPQTYVLDDKALDFGGECGRKL